MDILKNMIAEKQQAYNQAKAELNSYKKLAKALKEIPELDKKIKEWAYYDYMRSGGTRYNSEENKRYTELLKDKLNEIKEIYPNDGHGLWTYQHYVKQEIRLNGAKAVK